MKTALVIEDDDNNMVLITHLLAAGGYGTIEARTGEEGVERVITERPDFIILDIQLPGIDGYEVLRRIRSAEADDHVPVIAMTSYAMAGDRERLLAAGCDGYIEKPIDPTTVLGEIRDIVEARS